MESKPNYPNGAKGWVKTCNQAGFDIEEITSAFLAEIRESVPMRLADAICRAPLRSDAEISAYDNSGRNAYRERERERKRLAQRLIDAV